MIAMHAKLSTLREINASVVLDQIRQEPPLSRAQIARRIGMTKPTVANALDLLLEAGLVRKTLPPGDIHYGAAYFEPVTDAHRVLGLDIGSRFVRGALADLDGVLLVRHDEPVADPDADAALAACTAVRDRLLAQAERPQVPIELAVVGVPGVVHPDEGVIWQSNRPGLEGVPIRRALTDALGLEVLAENDINLAALGEQVFGAGRQHRDFAFLSVGSGVGAGLVLGGQLYRGHRGAAGEIDNPAPGETEALDSPSGDALLALAARQAADALASPVSGALPSPAAGAPPSPVSAEQIFAAAKAGNPAAHALLREQARRIAVRIADIALVTDVELVVLGGGIGSACADLLPQIETVLTGLLRYPPQVEISQLGDTPVLAGALARAAELATRAVTRRGIGGQQLMRPH